MTGVVPAIGIGIAIVAVVIMGAVIFYQSPIVEHPSENIAIQISNSQIWVSNNGTASVAGLVVQNTGGKAVSVEKILVKGQLVPIGSWYYNNDPSVATASNIKKELKFDDTLGTIDVTGDGSPEQFTHASGPLPLQQGQAMFLYLANPADITAVDAGSAVTMNIQAGKAAAVESVNVVDG